MESSNGMRTKTHTAMKSTAQVLFLNKFGHKATKARPQKPSAASLLQPRLTLHSCAEEPETLIQPMTVS